MDYECIKITAEAASTRELNQYLNTGWVLIQTYVKHLSDTQQPRFVVGWRGAENPVYPELLDEWEINEIDRQKYR